jgi:hypothetical protein
LKVKKNDDPVDTLAYFQSRNSIDQPLNNIIQTKLPQGPEYSGFNMAMYLRIIDDTNGVTTYQIGNQVTVHPDNNDTSTLLNDILNSNTGSTFTKDLFSGDLKKNAQTISTLSSLINSKSYSDKNSLSLSGS